MAPGIDNLPGSPYSMLASRFTNSFQQFVKDIADAKTKSEEDRVVCHELERLKVEITKPVSSQKQRKEQFVKLIYCNMLGHDVSFANWEAVKNAQQQDLMHKNVSYIALGLFLNERNIEERMMNMGTITRDLQNSNVLNVCFGLNAASKLVYNDMMQAVLPIVQKLTKDKREMIRKRAVMTLFRFWRLNPDACDYLQYFNGALLDTDPGVMRTSLTAYHDVISEEPMKYKKLTATFVNILKQVIDRRLPEEFNYKGYPAPWMQIKLLKILAFLGSDDKNESKKMYEILRQCLETTITDQLIGSSVVYECLKTISSIYINQGLVEIATNKVSVFLMSDDYNMKYLGIKALSDFVAIDVSYAARHQQIVIDCLNDNDDTLKRKTLDLLYRMANVTNVKIVCEKMIDHLRSTMDEFIRTNLVTRITTLAEKFAPDNEWYIETMNEVFELGGNLVQDDVAHNVMRLIGEGIDDDGDDDNEEAVVSEATLDLRRHAVFSYVTLMDKPALPDVLVKLICWVIGEYLEEENGYDMKEIVDKLYELLYRRFMDNNTSAWIITGISKILARSPNPSEFFKEVDVSLLNMETRQRYYEMEAIVRLCSPDEIEHLFPYDASCDEMDLDEDLSFLDDFVQDALNDGATPYSPDDHCQPIEDEDDATCQASVKEDLTPIRFDAYEAPTQRQTTTLPDAQLAASLFPPTRAEESAPSPMQPQQFGKSDPSMLSGKQNKWQKNVGLVQKSDDSDAVRSSSPASSSSGAQSMSNYMDSGQKTTVTSEEGSSSKTSEDRSSDSRSHRQRKDEELGNALFGGQSTSSYTPKRTGTGRSAPRKKTPSRMKTPPAKPVSKDSSLLLEVSSSEQDQNKANVDLLQDLDFGSTAPSGDGTSILFPLSTQLDTLATQQSNVDDLLGGLEIHQDPAENVQQQPVPQTIEEPSLLPYEEPESPLPDNPIPQLSDTSTSLIPEILRGIKSSLVTDLVSDICLRITSQFVYVPDELAVIFYVSNKTMNSVKNIRFSLTPPSSLRGNPDETKFERVEELQGTTSFCHVINLRFHSPAPHMVLNGYVSYKDFTNTEKKIFFDLVVPWSAVLRPLELDTKEFEEGWLNRSLHKVKKNVESEISMIKLKKVLEELNVHQIQETSNQLIASCTVLEKDQILLHFEISKQKNAVDVSVKSSSERLNQCLLKTVSSVL